MPQTASWHLDQSWHLSFQCMLTFLFEFCCFFFFLSCEQGVIIIFGRIGKLTINLICSQWKSCHMFWNYIQNSLWNIAEFILVLKNPGVNE